MVADNASARGAPNDFAAHLTTELRDGLRCLVRRWVCTAEHVPQADPADAVATAKMSSGWKRSATSNTADRSEEHTSELQSPCNLVCRLLLEKKKNNE